MTSVLSTFTTTIVTAPTGTDGFADGDPIADQQPPFSYSLVVQVMMNGILLTLCVALYGLLAFTARYHWPLAKLNFLLQTAALTVFLTITVTSTAYVLWASRRKSHEAPYMFHYVELMIPPDHWTKAQHVVAYTFIGLVALGCHLTHIQFLTLLFPSQLEKRLILILLLPLALGSSCLTYLSLHPSDRIQDLGDAIRAVCNASLTLLYTSALLIWGLLINRSRAWRSEGSTASFGALAVFFGLVGSILNYIEIKEDRLMWLQNSVWCILLWQSWVSFWWWVSTGMYAGEVQDRDVREAQARRKAAKRRAKMRRKQAGTSLPAVALSASGTDSISERIARRLGISRTTSQVPEIEGARPNPSRSSSVTSFSRLTDNQPGPARRRAANLQKQTNGDSIELQDMSAQHAGPERAISEASSSEIASSWKHFALWPRFMTRMMLRLQKAHDKATRTKALELPMTNDPSQGPFSVFSSANLDNIQQNAPSQGHHRNPSDQTSRREVASPRIRDYVALNEPQAGPSTDPRGAGMPRDSWHWKGGVRKARLKAVDSFPE